MPAMSSNRSQQPPTAPTFIDLENKSAEQLAKETKDLADGGAERKSEEPVVAENETAVQEKLVEVKLLHHITLPDGKNGVPGATVKLPAARAATLIGGKYAVSVDA